jgi:hypothetical protein
MSLRHNRRLSGMRESSPTVAAKTAAPQPRKNGTSRARLHGRSTRAGIAEDASDGDAGAGCGYHRGGGQGAADGGCIRPRGPVRGERASIRGAGSPESGAVRARRPDPGSVEGSVALDGRERDPRRYPHSHDALGRQHWYQKDEAALRRLGASEIVQPYHSPPLGAEEAQRHSGRARLLNRYALGREFLDGKQTFRTRAGSMHRAGRQMIKLGFSVQIRQLGKGPRTTEAMALVRTLRTLNYSHRHRCSGRG